MPLNPVEMEELVSPDLLRIIVNVEWVTVGYDAKPRLTSVRLNPVNTEERV